MPHAARERIELAALARLATHVLLACDARDLAQRALRLAGGVNHHDPIGAGPKRLEHCMRPQQHPFHAETMPRSASAARHVMVRPCSEKLPARSSRTACQHLQAAPLAGTISASDHEERSAATPRGVRNIPMLRRGTRVPLY